MKKKKRRHKAGDMLEWYAPGVVQFLHGFAALNKAAAKVNVCWEKPKMYIGIKPKVYISGAIAHYDLKERMETFGNAAKKLSSSGFAPVNPFNNGVPQSAHWTEHMRVDIGLLLECDHIYMLKGWELSKGAKLELDVASSCGIKVMYEK